METPTQAIRTGTVRAPDGADALRHWIGLDWARAGRRDLEVTLCSNCSGEYENPDATTPETDEEREAREEAEEMAKLKQRLRSAFSAMFVNTRSFITIRDRR
jgi:hypothetical protein